MLRRNNLLGGADSVKLPTGYTKLQYLECGGNSYIDTGFKPNNNTKVVFRGYNDSTSSGWIFGT